MKTIKINYEKADGYKLIPVTGAWGGVAPNGEIIIDFFVERQETPKSIVVEVDEKGKPEEKSREGGERYVREKQFGIVLRPDIALSIGNFIVKKAKSVTEAVSWGVDNE